MINTEINEFKEKAKEIFGQEREKNENDSLLSFLYSLNWDIPKEPPFSEKRLTRMNLAFDERTCFGRSVKAAVLAERYFPQEEIRYGEVKSDLFRELLIKGAAPENWQDESYLQEILQYEDPHSIIVWKDKQFDPIFLALGDNAQNFKHPEIGIHPIWEGLYASYLVSYSLWVLWNTQNTQKSLDILEQAEKICPQLLLPQENKIASLISLNRQTDAIRQAKMLVGKRKDVKTIFSLWLMTRENKYEDMIREEYSEEMFNFLIKTYLS